MVSHDEFENIWKKPAVKIGFITVIIPTLMCFLPNIYLYLRYGAFPPVSVALKSWGMIVQLSSALFMLLNLFHTILFSV